MQNLKTVLSGEDKLSPQIKKIKGELDNLSNSAEKIDKFKEKFEKISNSTAPLKRQLRDLQAIMAQMNMDGLSNTEQFTQIAEKAGQIKDAIADASAATQRFASDTFKLDAAIQGLQGIAGAAAVATGAMSLLGKQNEDVARAIQKVQAVLAILNGVQSVSNILNKDSALMQRIKQIQLAATTAATNKATVAEGANTVATVTNTNVTKAWNMVKAISKALLGDWTGLLLVGAAALGTYAIATSDNTDEIEKQNSALGKGESALQSYQEKAKDTYSNLIDKYVNLKIEWNSLTSTHKKNEWIKNNQSAFSELGVSVNNVTDAEKVFNGNTDAIVAAFKARAQAAAEAAKLTELYKQRLQTQDAKDAAVAGAKAKGLVDSPIIQAANAQLDAIDKEIEKSEKRVSDLAKSMPKIKTSGGGKSNTSRTSGGNKSNTIDKTPLEKIKEKTNKVDYSKLGKNALKGEKVEVPLEYKPAKTSEQLKEEIFGNTSTWTDELQKNINGLFAERWNIQARFDAGDINLEDAQAALDKISGMLKLDVPFEINTSKLEKTSETLKTTSEYVEQLGSSLGELGSAFELPELNVAAAVAQAIATIVGAYAETLAKDKTSKSNIWTFIAAAAAATISMTATIASIKKASGFANGGVIGGNSYSGDKLLARVNSGEVILPAKKASELGDMLATNAQESYSSVQWRIKGSDLYGTLHNYSKVKAKSGKITGIK